MRKLLLTFSFSFLMIFCAFAQNIVVKGKVTSDEDGSPVIGASVRVKGNSKIGASINNQGEFNLSVPSDSKTLLISAVGFKTIEKAISSAMNVVMSSQQSNLDEVVVVAYGKETKRSLTGSVATVSATQMEKQQTTNVGQSLQGLAAGVTVVNTSGQPGQTPQIRIRGIGSINADASPLWVVDGVPFYGDVSTINSNDIESMSVLKDASATALYGSRAANGVVLVNTKKGKAGEAKINAYMSYGLSSRAIKEYKYLNPAQFMELAWEANRNYAQDLNVKKPGTIADPAQYATDNLITGTNGLRYNPYNVANPVGTDGKLLNDATLKWNTDWNKALTNSAAARKALGANISGATNAINYFISADYLDQDGSVINSNFKRISVRSNVTAKVRTWMDLGLNTNIVSTAQNFPNQSGSTFANAIGFARGISSIYPLYMRDDNGDLLLNGKGQPQFDYGNRIPGRTLNQNRPYGQNTNSAGTQRLNQSLTDRLQTSLNTYANIKFTDFLFFKSTLGVDRFLNSGTTYINGQFGDAASISGRLRQYRNATNTYTWNNMLNYNQSFGKHNLGAMASYEAFSYNQRNLNAQKTTFPAPNIFDLTAGAKYENAESPSYDETLESMLARLTYNYANKYFIEGTVRRDGSSRFAPNRRWGTFYAVGASWNISSENFLKESSWVDLLKLRGSYGEVGNNRLLTNDVSSDIGARSFNLTANYFPYLTTYNFGSNDLGNSGVYISNFANANIGWEKLGTYDVGFDFSFFKGKVSGSVDYFNKNTFDLLGSIVKAPSTGLISIDSNIGSIQNSGFEFSVNTQNIQRADFKWTTTFNLATLKNKITSQNQPSVISGSFRRAVGLPLYNFYISEWAGVNPDNGLPQWYADDVDANGKIVGKKIVNKYTQATRYDLGSALPKVTGGITNTFQYKDFDFSFLINFALGGKILDGDYIGLMGGNNIVTGSQQSADLLNRWQKPGDITDVPRLSVGQTDYGNASTRHLVSGSYARLRNVTLGYTIPIQKFTNNYVKNLRVYLQADNTLVWKKAKIDGLDPEVALNGVTSTSSTPFKTFTFGLNFGF